MNKEKEMIIIIIIIKMNYKNFYNSKMSKTTYDT